MDNVYLHSDDYMELGVEKLHKHSYWFCNIETSTPEFLRIDDIISDTCSGASINLITHIIWGLHSNIFTKPFICTLASYDVDKLYDTTMTLIIHSRNFESGGHQKSVSGVFC